MKKIVSLLLTLVMVLGLVPAMADEADVLAITEEEITLTYATKGEDLDLTYALIDNFNEKYPNITVEVLELDPTNLSTALGNLAAEKKLPDVFWVDSVTDAVANEWALRLDDYFAADPDAAKIGSGIMKLMQIGGRRYSVPAQSRPKIMVVNKTLFETYNVELPEYDWDFDEFVAVAEAVAHPENYHFGCGHLFGHTYIMPSYGWDGESYAFGEDWLKIEELAVDWTNRKVSESMTSEEKQNVFGDGGAWAFNEGYAATQIHSFGYDAEGFMDGTRAAATGSEYLIYPVPTVQGYVLDDMIFACVNRATQYPNEAWLLAKWMTWGKEATMFRDTWFNENEVVQNSMPMIDDEEVKANAIEMADDALKMFFTYCGPSIPDPGSHAPNMVWCNVDWWFSNLQTKFANGELVPADYQATLVEKYNKNRDDWFNSCSDFATATDLDITTTDAE